MTFVIVLVMNVCYCKYFCTYIIYRIMTTSDVQIMIKIDKNNNFIDNETFKQILISINPNNTFLELKQKYFDYHNTKNIYISDDFISNTKMYISTSSSFNYNGNSIKIDISGLKNIAVNNNGIINSINKITTTEIVVDNMIAFDIGKITEKEYGPVEFGKSNNYNASSQTHATLSWKNPWFMKINNKYIFVFTQTEQMSNAMKFILDKLKCDIDDITGVTIYDSFDNHIDMNLTYNELLHNDETFELLFKLFRKGHTKKRSKRKSNSKYRKESKQK